MIFLPKLERILLTFWVGGLWVIGYVAAPTLFAMLDDRHLAGELAGRLFQIIHIIGLFCAALLWISLLAQRRRRALHEWRCWLLIVMAILMAVGLFVLQPMIADLKVQGEMIEGSALARQFGRLHGLASILYLLTSLSGLVLVAQGFRKSTNSISS